MLYKLKNNFFVLILLFANLAINAEEIRKINPPNLDNLHLGKKILCHRPMRRGSPKMEIQNIEDKVVAHNYGHGGSGWTLGPGSAKYVNDLLIKKHADELSLDTPITIIGRGALGLFSAFDLVERGYTNITIIAKASENLTSHNAGGLLAPVSMDNDPALQPIIDQIGIDAYKFYEAIAKKDPSSKFQEGALIVPTYFRNREDSGLESYVGKVMQEAKDVVLDFGNGKTQQMVSYDDGIFIDTAIMMKSLNEYLKPFVKFETKEITSFAEIDTKFIVNCTGLGAKELNNDQELVSVQGHLVMLKDQNPEDLKYMILVYFNEGKTENNQKVKRSFYIFPKKLEGSDANEIGVIGGTFIENADSSTPNDNEFEIMIQNAKDFYGIN